MKIPTKKQICKPFPRNERGVVLALAIMVVGILITLSAGFTLSTFVELRAAQSYRDKTKAFWMASSGIHEFLDNAHYLDRGPQTISFGSSSVVVSKDDSDRSRRVVRAVTQVGVAQQGIEVTFAGPPADLFRNTLTNGSDLTISGLTGRLDVNGKTRIGDAYSKTGLQSVANFVDKKSGQGTASTTLTYPDFNRNGTADEFADFVQYYRNEMITRPPSETVWIQPVNPDDTVIIIPNQQLSKKKLIFIDAPEGKGDVTVIIDANWQPNKNLTIVSTGDITYVQPLQLNSNAKLNLISWKSYNEASYLYSAHNGFTYAHEDVNYFYALSYSYTTGNIVANRDLKFFEALTWQVFDFASPIDRNGNAPPGFKGLVSPAAGGYSLTPDSWKEI